MAHTARRCPTCRKPGPASDFWCPRCNPRPRLGDPSRPSFQCPSCGLWHQVHFGGHLVAVRCTCKLDEHGRGVLVWEARPRHDVADREPRRARTLWGL